ncbi:hypothetical protein CGZ93_15940 [Enemella dayhoffiae]|uniref:LGFP repeat-containing protein n=1 Tax=Enemella dayhoffiae TaxID=2016507 RepID=A0A255GQF8_9ACTN|nr:hypothetical protein [Enemella dayhoffiae]OYO18055.1 hypothetical protein CGZ93_15940 [Enemella dayhoffiae]
MSRWMRRAALSLSASAAVLIGLAGPAGAAPPQPGPTDPATEGLRQAVRRDLGLEWPEYLARGAAAERAADLDRQLQGTPDYRGVALQGAEVVVTGGGDKVDREARNAGARVTANGRRAASAEPMLQKYLAEVGAEGLGSVQVTADGWLITVARPDQPRNTRSGRSVSPQQFAAQNPGVRLQAGGPATQRADVLGGQGWEGFWSGGGLRCSIGFAGFDPAGRQEMVSAGHCTRDNQVNQARLEADPGVFLGNRTFGQFGGPNNASNTQSTAGTDLSIFVGPSQDLLPMVDAYGWRSKVTGVSNAVVGAPVCTAGRTSRKWSCSTIDGVGAFAVGGFRGDDDVRYVNGFGSQLTTLGGDSGGSMVSGLKAIGVLSAGDNYNGVEYSYGANLDTFRSMGHQVELWLANPVANAGAAGGRITGRVPVDGGDTVAPNTQVRISANGTTSTVPVAADGTFSFTAPGNGSQVTLTTINGYSGSGAATWTPANGTPTGERICGLRDGGCFQPYAGGIIYWSSAGSYLVKGAIYNKWSALGWEKGQLGYPTSGEICGLRDGGCYQRFQGGRIYWSPSSGAHPVWGLIADKWDSTNYEWGTLGYPTGDENCGLRDGGCFQTFQNGMLYWSPRSGAHWIRGAIQDRWAQLGWERSRFGYPLSDENCGLRDGGCYQVFSAGAIYWSPRTGAQPVEGAIWDYWGRNGWEGGRFGYPVAGESCSGTPTMRCTQPYQGGTITWTASGGAAG